MAETLVTVIVPALLDQGGDVARSARSIALQSHPNIRVALAAPLGEGAVEAAFREGWASARQRDCRRLVPASTQFADTLGQIRAGLEMVAGHFAMIWAPGMVAHPDLMASLLGCTRGPAAVDAVAPGMFLTGPGIARTELRALDGELGVASRMVCEALLFRVCPMPRLSTRPMSGWDAYRELAHKVGERARIRIFAEADPLFLPGAGRRGRIATPRDLTPQRRRRIKELLMWHGAASDQSVLVRGESGPVRHRLA